MRRRLLHAAYWVAYRLLLAYWFVLRPRHPSAHVAVWVGEELLVIETSYKPWVWVPGGGIGRGETPRDAAARELGEEVGIQVEAEELAEFGVVESHAEFNTDLAHFFELVRETPPSVSIDEIEVVAARFVRPETIDGTLAAPVRAYLAARDARGAPSRPR